MTKQEFLAISLPYGLKCKTLDIEVEDFDTMFYFQEFEANEKSIYNETYPYLHPLSYLTKEIEHNGEKFVPIERVEESFIEGTDDLLVLSLEAIDYFIENEDFSRIEYLPSILIRKLIEWHFDIAGLIEKGEAIDVNTLPENPYK